MIKLIKIDNLLFSPRIINANFSIPEADSTYPMFHDLIRQMLVVDPTCRPTAQQVQVHLGEVSVISGWDMVREISEQSCISRLMGKPDVSWVLGASVGAQRSPQIISCLN